MPAPSKRNRLALANELLTASREGMIKNWEREGIIYRGEFDPKCSRSGRIIVRPGTYSPSRLARELYLSGPSLSLSSNDVDFFASPFSETGRVLLEICRIAQQQIDAKERGIR